MNQPARKMQATLEPGRIDDIKKAVKYLRESIEESTTEKKINLQLGVVLAPELKLEKSQAVTLLNKFSQALSNFKDDAIAGMSLQFTLEVDNSEEKAILECTQKKMEASAILMKGPSNVKAATPEQVAAVSQDSKVQKAIGELKA